MRECTEIIHGSAQYRQTLVLRQRVLRTPLGLVLSAEDTADEDRQRHFAMLDEQQLLACVVIKPLNMSAAKLRQMAVLPSCRGQGVGQQLIVAVEEVLRRGGVTRIEMSARQSAVGFYARLGYRADGGLYVEQGIPHVRMEKFLCTTVD